MMKDCKLPFLARLCGLAVLLYRLPNVSSAEPLLVIGVRSLMVTNVESGDTEYGIKELKLEIILKNIGTSVAQISPINLRNNGVEIQAKPDSEWIDLLSEPAVVIESTSYPTCVALGAKQSRTYIETIRVPFPAAKRQRLDLDSAYPYRVSAVEMKNLKRFR